MSKYDDALLFIASEYGDATAAEIEELLAKWRTVPRDLVGNRDGGKGVYIVPRIKAEEHLPLQSMVDILLELHKAQSLLVQDSSGSFDKLSVFEFEGIYVEKCRCHQREGGPIKLSSPRVVGQAVRKTRLRAILREQNHVGDAQFNDLITRLSTSPGSLRSFEGTYLVGGKQRTAWMTWNRDDPGGYPFHFASIPFQAERVRANLGLSAIDHRGILLLFTYSTDFTDPLVFPTVADAELFEYFQPSDKLHLHGWTCPWSKDHIKHHGEIVDLAPRPEAVHLTIPLSYARGLEEAK